MHGSKTREKILKKIRAALIQPSEGPTAPQTETDILFDVAETEISFAQNYVSLGGQLVYCENELEFAAQLIELCSRNSFSALRCRNKTLTDFLIRNEFPVINDHAAGNSCVELVYCSALISQTGQLVTDSNNCDQFTGSTLKVFVAGSHQIISNFRDLFQDIKDTESLPASLFAFTVPDDQPCFLFLLSQQGMQSIMSA